MAMLFATIAFSIDAMLPALPKIASDLSPDAPNNAQLIITSFFFGMGLGTLFTGPLSDAFGRKPVIVAGALLYAASAFLAWIAPTLEMILLARVLQGLGTAAPRVVALAIIRDLYAGRQMAQLMSFVMLVFTLVPAVAPALGAAIIWGFGWRSIFIAFIAFSAISVCWLTLRQPETLPPERRRAFRVRQLAGGVVEVLSSRQVVLCIAVLTLVFGMLLATISTIQPIFETTFQRGAEFPLWFAGIALLSGTASLLNARIVVRVGMRPVIVWALAAQIAVSTLMAASTWLGVWSNGALFAAYLVWTTGVFFMVGLTLGNLSALAMEPMGHLAGMAASIIGSISTVAAVVIAIPIGLAFDGTPFPVAIGITACAIAAFLVMQFVRGTAAIVERGA